MKVWVHLLRAIMAITPITSPIAPTEISPRGTANLSGVQRGRVVSTATLLLVVAIWGGIRIEGLLPVLLRAFPGK